MSDIKLYNVDCMEFMKQMPDKSVDIILTDPPYGMNFVSNHRKEKHRKIEGDDHFPSEIFEHFFRISRKSVYVFCRWDNLTDIPKPKSFLCWVKNNWSMGDLKHEHGRQWEGCAFYPMEGHDFIKRIPDVINIKRTGNDLHPTEKPVSLLEIILMANKGNTVFDPFFGSCSCGVASINCNRDFIGCEIDEQYYNTGVRRLDNHRKQQQLFI